MAGTRRLTQLREQMASRSLFPEGEVTVALSGGADSAALADLALTRGLHVSALHINHSWSASSQMEAAAGHIASQLDIEMEVVTVEVPKGPSPEANARDVRYKVFDGCDTPVLTGHTADDNAETVLINLIRGTGISGLTGIPYHRPPNVLRPILKVRRSETRELAVLAGLGFVDDPANTDQAITRNRVRAQLLPVLTEFNPRIVDTLNQTSAHLNDDAELLDALSPLVPDHHALPASILLTVEPALASRLLLHWLRSNGVASSSGIVERVWSVVRGESASQELEHGVVVRRSGALVELVGTG